MDGMGEDPPVIFPTGAGRKSACRPPPDPGVTMRHIPGPHHGATADRRRAGPVIPAVRDTTTMDHSHLRAKEGLPETGGGGSGSVGVPARAGPAVTPEGRPPGLFAMDAGHAECLRDHVAAPHAPAVTDLTVPAAGGAGARGERTARPGLRAAEVTVIPPGRATDAEPLSVPAVPSTGTGPRRTAANPCTGRA